MLIDNLTCRRRFHLVFDDETPKQEEVQIQCLHCGALVFSEKNHPAVSLARDENLIQTTQLSPLRTRDCAFQDKYPPKK